jgi:hypothetical protein
MLTKILFTALVIAVVYAVYRARSGAPATGPRRLAPVAPDNRFGRIAAYGFIGVLILVSSIFYYLHWREEHRVISIRVIDSGSGEATTYRAYRKSIKESGKRFQSLDGRTVIVGDAERVEILGPE